jgi:hypothetical protein
LPVRRKFPGAPKGVYTLHKKHVAFGYGLIVLLTERNRVGEKNNAAPVDPYFAGGVVRVAFFIVADCISLDFYSPRFGECGFQCQGRDDTGKEQRDGEQELYERIFHGIRVLSAKRFECQ